MRRFVAVLLTTLASTGPLSIGSAFAAAETGAPARQRLTSFPSERELGRFLERVARQQRRERLRSERNFEHCEGALRQRLERLTRERERLLSRREKLGPHRFARELARLDEKDAGAFTDCGYTETVTVSAGATPIVNLQQPGVDEGGLVKRHGDYLVILRRGRLFTVAISGTEIRPVTAVDAFDPRIQPKSDGDWTWYDELLISGNTVVVIGYSYERDGTEIGLFDIDPAGDLRHRGTYHLRSNDYYTATNYSSRLIGTKLVIFTSSTFDDEAQGLHGLPELREWAPSATNDQFQRIAASNRIYRPVHALEKTSEVILHTVTSCDLASARFSCEATVVIGESQRAFYVSRSSVYIWTVGSGLASAGSQSTVYRVPLDGSSPAALRVRGVPFNQFSFFESDDRYLNVVVGGAIDGSHRHPSPGRFNVFLLRVALEQFADGTTSAPQASYTPLSRCESGQIENRFVGLYLLVSCGSTVTSADADVDSTLSVVPWAARDVIQFDVPLWVIRIEPMGEHAVVIGPTRSSWNTLRFATIRLNEQRPTLADTFTLMNAFQSDHRSHAFAYLPENATDGVIGLPVVGTDDRGVSTGSQDTGAIAFFRSRALVIEDAGLLVAAVGPSDDACRASCADWYGNARPLFVGSRVFALLGYEIIEAVMTGGRLIEVGRVSFAPLK